MSFLAPLLLFSALGVALPILAHLLSRHKVQRTEWAAMQFLDRSVRVRSRQIRLRDLLLLSLRCLAILSIVLGLSRPFLEDATGVAARVGERRSGVIIALDASASMGHGDGRSTRFDRALDRVRRITAELQPGDPISLVLLGAEHRVVARNQAFDPAGFQQLLEAQRVTDERLHLDDLPRTLRSLADGMDAPQREIYLVSDLQARDWSDRPAWLRQAFKELSRNTPTTVVPVPGGVENVAITDLELVSGVLRRDTIARYRATVRNCGSSPAENVRVRGLVDGDTVDTKTIPLIAPGASETTSLFVHFRNAGNIRISAELDRDTLPLDDVRRAVAVVRDEVSVLCVEGSTVDTGAGLLGAALRARGAGSGQENFAVQSVSWIDLPSQDLANFDVVVLRDVPDITVEQARSLEAHVRAGHGLIWFPGDHIDAAAWNERSALDRAPLLPAIIEQRLRTSNAMGVGRPLDPTLRDHPVCRPLRSLPEDLLSETRFQQVLQVQPAATGTVVLSLAGTAAPVLLEHSVGRGQVLMFTTSADSAWSNLAVTPVFPMVLQQMVTYLTAREFERPRRVGDSLALSYPDRPDASEAVFESPSGETRSVPVREHRGEFVALLEHAGEAGFHLARVRLQAPGVPIAVNADTAESDVRCLSAAETTRWFAGSDTAVARSEEELIQTIESARSGRSLWLPLLLFALALLVLESLLATRTKGSVRSRPEPGEVRE